MGVPHEWQRNSQFGSICMYLPSSTKVYLVGVDILWQSQACGYENFYVAMRLQRTSIGPSPCQLPHAEAGTALTRKACMRWTKHVRGLPPIIDHFRPFQTISDHLTQISYIKVDSVDSFLGIPKSDLHFFAGRLGVAAFRCVVGFMCPGQVVTRCPAISWGWVT